jgi:hypothetical protein
MVRYHAVMRITPVVACAAWLACSCGTALAAVPHSHGHHHSEPADEAAASSLPAAPGGLTITLQDVKRPSGRGRIAWSTYWKLCWQPVAGAKYFEKRLLTSEGAPRKPERINTTCFRVEAAAGENPSSEGLPKRDLMLSMQAAQSAVQIRAVFRDGHTTAWTAEQPIGEIRP